MAAVAVKLRPVEVSPSTIQYAVPRTKPPSIYKRRFHPNEDAKKTLTQPWIRITDPMMPPYPYGKNVFFDEANQGLYGGATIQSGNKISQGRNKGKTLRKWYPNVRVEQLKSDALNVKMSLPTTARVMRTIRKCGGLDQYLLGPKPARIKELGLLGWKLRWLVMNSKAMKDKHAAERSTLGLPETTAVDATFDQAWADPQTRAEITQKMQEGWENLGQKDEKFKQHVRRNMNWKEDIPELHALRIYDPAKVTLPDRVVEEEPKRPAPEVQEWFGIQELERSQKRRQKPGGRKRPSGMSNLHARKQMVQQSTGTKKSEGSEKGRIQVRLEDQTRRKRTMTPGKQAKSQPLFARKDEERNGAKVKGRKPRFKGNILRLKAGE